MEKLCNETTAAIGKNVADALAEDIGSGDLTAELVAADDIVGATIIARQTFVLAGQAWVNEVFGQLDDAILVDWYVSDGQTAESGDVICKLVGNARALLSGERTALNFLQTLSATATTTATYVRAIDGIHARILDTRKTLPGLRRAQKYAVRIGGGANHRVGLFDASLIKENHIKSCGSITKALALARSDRSRALSPAGSGLQQDEVLIEVEIDSIDELREALDAGGLEFSCDVSIGTVNTYGFPEIVV